MESSITAKGQATIPKAIRDHLRLKPGDRVKFFVHPDGSVVLLPKTPASALRGHRQASAAAASDNRRDERSRRCRRRRCSAARQTSMISATSRKTIPSSRRRQPS
jgi:AbrB family looped-hinge helix DNA binding protein